MADSLINVQNRQPNDVVVFMADIQSEQQRITGVGHSRNLVAGRGLHPSTFIAACLNVADRLKRDDPDTYYGFLDFKHRIGCALASLATRLRASPSERTYLTALVDMLDLQPTLVMRGNYQVCLSAKDARQYVDLSPSSCTAARNALSAKGIIAIDGDRIDLAPLIETLEPLLSQTITTARPLGIQEAPPVVKETLPKSGTPRDNVKSNVSYKKETLTIESSNDMFEVEAIRETIALSRHLKSGIEDHIGCDLNDASKDVILGAIPTVSQKLFLSLFGLDWGYARLWNKMGWVKHGLHALSALVTAIESPPRDPGKWYYRLLELPKLDASSNIKALVASKEKAKRAGESAILAEKAKADRAQALSRNAEIGMKALQAFEDVRADGAVSAPASLWLIAADRLYAKDDGNVVSWAIRSSSNSTEKSTLLLIAKAIAERLGLSKSVFQLGTFADIRPLSSFNNRLRMVEV